MPSNFNKFNPATSQMSVRPQGTQFTQPQGGFNIPRPHTDWDDMHPQWQGSNIAYWSMRIKAIIQWSLGNYNSGNPIRDKVEACSNALESNYGMERLYSFLRKQRTVAAFILTYSGTGGPAYTALPPGLWFANQQDGTIAVRAARDFLYNYCVGYGPGGPGIPGSMGEPAGSVGAPAEGHMKHVVTGRETPRDVTRKYTGSGSRVSELVEANPEWPKVVAAGMVGNPVTFDPTFWRDGVQVNLPDSWGAGAVGRPYQGAVGEDGTGQRVCSVDPINEAKPYYLLVAAGDYPDKIAKQWLGGSTTGTGPLTTRYLLRVNHDKPGGFLTDTEGNNCNFKYFNSGDIIKIPAAWPAPPAAFEARLVNIDGSKYTPTGNEVEPVTPGSENMERVNWSGYSEASGWVWPVLIVGAAALGGVLLVGASKKGSSK